MNKATIIRQLSNYSNTMQNKLLNIINQNRVSSIDILNGLIGMRNSDSILVYSNLAQFQYKIQLLKHTGGGIINCYYYKIIQFKGQYMILVVYTDRIVVYFKQKIILQVKLIQTLQNYQYFCYDKHNQYLAIIGTTFASNFSVVLVVKLIASHQQEESLNLLQLTIDYKSVYNESGCYFPNLSDQYMTLNSLCFLPKHQLVLYNKEFEELYICDVNQLLRIYNTKIDKTNYDDNIFKSDQIQNSVPFQCIKGVYTRVKAECVRSVNNRIELVQKMDPISGVVYRDTYQVEVDMNLRFLDCVC